GYCRRRRRQASRGGVDRSRRQQVVGGLPHGRLGPRAGAVGLHQARPRSGARVSEAMAVAAVLYLHAMVWLWIRPCLVDPWRSAFSPEHACAKGVKNCVVWHGDESWQHPHGMTCVELGLINRRTGDPLYDEMKRGWT